jgi:predicted DNA-binding transcriptional regulator YafY
MNKDDQVKLDPPPLVFTYTNHRGETSVRHVIPKSIRFGTTPDHTDTWLLNAFDLDRNATRTFDLSKMVKGSETP